MALLTHERLRQELRLFAEDSLRRELTTFGSRLKANICQEVKLAVSNAAQELKIEPFSPKSGCDGWGVQAQDLVHCPYFQAAPGAPVVAAEYDYSTNKSHRGSVESGIGCNKLFSSAGRRSIELNGPSSHMSASQKLALPGAVSQETIITPIPGAVSTGDSDKQIQEGNGVPSPKVKEMPQSQTAGPKLPLAPTLNVVPAPCSADESVSKPSDTVVRQLLVNSVDAEEQCQARQIGNRTRKVASLKDDSTFVGMREKARKLINWGVFEYTIIGSIFVNAMTIGAQTNYYANTLSEDAPRVFNIFETVFCFIFTFEIILRMYVNRCMFFIGDGWSWNLFDLFVVLLQLMEKGVELFNWLLQTSSKSANFSFMRIMRILRLIRVVRLVRLLHLIQELRTLVSSLLGSLKSLMWTMALLLLLIYIISVYFTQVVSDHRLLTKNEENGEASSEELDDLYRFFQSVPRAILSLFQAMSGGIDWDSLANPLATEISPFLGFVIAMYIAFALLAVMNVVTGVFVESAMKGAQHEQEVFMVQHARKLFMSGDRGRSGKINWVEFQNQMDDPEMQVYFKLIEVDFEEASELFQLMDIGKGGEVDYEEFLNGCLRLRGHAKAIDLVTLMLESRRHYHQWSLHMAALEKDVAWIVNFLAKWLSHAQLTPSDSSAAARLSSAPADRATHLD
jgi:voltage-gated sodium channel